MLNDKKIIYGTYEVDVFEINNDKLLALTQHNSEFIEAVIRMDSNYKNESDYVKPDNNFNLEDNSKNADNKYCGSTKYWFDEMKSAKTQEDYKKCIWGAVVAIDRSNSTHLETTDNGRKLMAEKIINKCPTLDSLKKELKKPFNKTDHLFTHIVKLESEPDENSMYYLSFASKFCSYAAFYLCPNGTEYSRYDNVVATNLPYYYEVYCEKKVAKSEYKVNYNNKDKFNERLNIYESYSCAIGEIIEGIKKKCIELNRDQVDHIIWYGQKGR